VQALDDARPLPAMEEPNEDVRAEPQPPATESMPLDVVTAATLAVAPVLQPSKTETSTAPTEVRRQESNAAMAQHDAAAEVAAGSAIFEPVQAAPADHAQNGVVMALADAKAVGRRYNPRRSTRRKSRLP
jgi:hypothetical protein